jgi:hypothetical protein
MVGMLMKGAARWGNREGVMWSGLQQWPCTCGDKHYSGMKNASRTEKEIVLLLRFSYHHHSTSAPPPDICMHFIVPKHRFASLSHNSNHTHRSLA